MLADVQFVVEYALDATGLVYQVGHPLRQAQQGPSHPVQIDDLPLGV